MNQKSLSDFHKSIFSVQKFEEMNAPHMMWIPNAETFSQLTGWSIEDSQAYLDKNGNLIDYSSSKSL